jgi:hypothetical protein
MSHKLIVTTFLIGAAIFVLSGCSASSEAEKNPMVEESKMDTEAEKPAVEKAEESAVEKAEKVKETVVEKAQEDKGDEVKIRVNCGAYEPYTDKAGNKWLPDQDMEEGRKWGVEGGLISDRGELNIADTNAPTIYQTERYSMDAYRFIVPNGKYTIRLHFAETYYGISGEGERVFSVSIDGKKVLTDFDPYKEGGGFEKPIVKEFKDVDVTGGEILIEFTPNIENPEINGIEILSE